jgi:hypothetical protein
MERFEEIRKLYDVWDDSFGIAEEIISRRERYLGKKLPEILRQYYLQLGNNKQINQSQDNLVLPTELEIYEDGFAVFYYENQVVWQAGIKSSDFAQDNPSVYLCYDQENWEFEIGNLFNFLTAEAFLQALFALPFNANACDVGIEKEVFVRQNWKASKFKSYLWGTEFFQNDSDEILALMKNKDQSDVFIATNDEKHFVDMNEKLEIDWDYNSLEDE